jgi:MFS transporter, DHA1 family, multidrug resistance protein
MSLSPAPPAISPSAPSAPARSLSEGGLILTLGLLAAFGPLAIDMYLPAFSAIAADLHTSTGAVGWTLAVYFVGIAVGQLLIGPITDRLGRTRPLRIGLAIFCLGSLAAALATSIELLVTARALQSLGGAACAVTSRAVVRDLYRGAEASRINSRLVLVMGIAPIVAPLLGGALLSLAGWRSIFFLLAGLGGLTLLAVRAVLPETAPPRAPSFSFFPFVRGLLFDRELMSFAIIAATSSAAMFAYITAAPMVFIEHYHVAPRNFGWFFGSNAAAYVAASQLNARLLRTRAPISILCAGVAGIFGVALLLLFGAFTDWGLWLTAASCCAFMGCLGLIMPNAVALALEGQGARAGGAAAWIGALQFGVAGAASAAVSSRHDTPALSMATTMLVLAMIAGGVLMAALTTARVARSAKTLSP